VKWDGIRLWSRILQMMDRLLKAASTSGHEGLGEAIPESLKNIVLVMSSGGYLVPPSGSNGGERTQVQRRLWEVTSKRLEMFLPGLLEAVFPGAGEAKPTPAIEITKEEAEKGMDIQMPIREEPEVEEVREKENIEVGEDASNEKAAHA
jgi:brefeldin A-resistance guanine nucleotide exchange factor 1